MDAGIRVLRHHSELGQWELVLRAPDPRLRAVVGVYEGYVETGAPDPPLRQQVPTTSLPLIVNFGAPWRVASSATGSTDTHDSFFAGLGERSSFVAAAGPASCMQVNFTPLGAHVFLGLPMHELANRIVPLDDVLPRTVRGLGARIEAATSWEERFDLLDAIFLAQLASARAPSTDVAWAWTALARTHGRAPIGWICDRLGRSRRHLAQRFREQVGLPPKTVARILRFERAVELLGTREIGLAELAFACGYYDQAHLNRDFRQFAGTSPGSFARRIVPDGGVIV
jgi:AraC-like DNA-binding protein